MELWIISQDKERLIKIDNLYIEYKGSFDKDYIPYTIYTDRMIELGIYKSKERALEVLDEIQTKIATYDYQHKDMKSDYIKYESCIFEMPKE